MNGAQSVADLWTRKTGKTAIAHVFDTQIELSFFRCIKRFQIRRNLSDDKVFVGLIGAGFAATDEIHVLDAGARKAGTREYFVINVWRGADCTDPKTITIDD
jgi:hypothetical protein